jgi:MFS transporter, putative metabolite transport protein
VDFRQLDSETLKPFHIRMTLLSAAGTFLDGFDLTVIAVALPFLVKQWHIGANLMGLVASSAVIGMLVGSLVLGNLTDRLGRKKLYVIDLLSFVVFAALTAFSQNVWELILFRFLLGLGIGADYPISSTLVAEFSSSEKRGQRITTLGAMWFVGAMAAYVVGMLMTPLGAQAWRYMLLIGAALALVVILLRAAIPESPRWLAYKGRHDEAATVLRQLTGQKVMSKELTTSKSRWMDLFSPQLWRRTLFVCVFWFAYDVAYYGISMYTPTILKTFTHGSQLGANIGATIVSLLSCIGAVIGFAVVDRWGRRPLILFSFAGLTIVLMVLALYPVPSFVTLVALFGLAVLLANMGPGVLDFVYPTELFPTGLRASATGLGTAVSRVGAILGVVTFPELVKTWGNGPSLWLFSAASMVGLVVSIWLAPETKHQSLEELNEHMESRASSAHAVSASIGDSV